MAISHEVIVHSAGRAPSTPMNSRTSSSCVPLAEAGARYVDVSDRLEHLGQPGDQRRLGVERSSSWQPADMVEVSSPGTTITGALPPDLGHLNLGP